MALEQLFNVNEPESHRPGHITRNGFNIGM
jgi:hypothetical protein